MNIEPKWSDIVEWAYDSKRLELFYTSGGLKPVLELADLVRSANKEGVSITFNPNGSYEKNGVNNSPIPVINGKTRKKKHVYLANERYPKANKRWSKQDLELLRNMVSNGSLMKDLTLALGRRNHGINVKISQLKMVKA